MSKNILIRSDFYILKMIFDFLWKFAFVDVQSRFLGSDERISEKDGIIVDI